MTIVNSLRVCWIVLISIGFLASAATGIDAQDARPIDPAPAPREYTEQLNIQFGKGLDAYPELQFFGIGVDEFHRFEPKGLRFTLPAERERVNEVGVEFRKAIRGDFELTLAYELLEIPIPGPISGAGVLFEAQFDTPDSMKANVTRTQKDKGANFGSSYFTADETGKYTRHSLNYPRANEKARNGRLRLTRTGIKVEMQANEGGGFRPIASQDLNGADVVAVRASVTSGYKSLLVDVRFANLELRWNPAAKVAAPAPVNDARPEPAVNQPPATTRTWVYIVIGAALLLLGLLVAIMLAWLLLGRRSSRRNVPAPATTSMVHFNCPSCGKNLKVKPSQAGKKVKCPQCGNAALVPEPQSAG